MSTVSVRRDGGAAFVTIARPDALGALDVATKEQLLAALEAVAADGAVRAVGLGGSGRAFCVGEDLRALRATYDGGGGPDLAATLERHYGPAIRLLAEMPKPTVALVNGVAAGAGASLAFACDLRVASEAASFKLAFSGVGLIPDAGSTYNLPRLVGLSRAMQLALLDDTVSAQEALRIGLVNRVFPAAEFDQRAAAIVNALAAGPTQALAAAKRLLRGGLHGGLRGALGAEATAQAAAGRTSDHLEGVRAFFDKRPPAFTGE